MDCGAVKKIGNVKNTLPIKRLHGLEVIAPFRRTFPQKYVIKLKPQNFEQ